MAVVHPHGAHNTSERQFHADDARSRWCMVRPVSNPPNPWHSSHVEWIDAPPPDAELQVYEEEAKSILSRNDSPDVPYRWSVNPYRGCFHACAYCYARPSHQYLDFGAGTDFDRKLIVKTNAAALLREAFDKPSWRGERVVFSGNTDCYQPLEATWGITRACLEICADYGNPVSIITKSAIVRRDIDILARMAEKNLVFVFVSLGFTDPVMARGVEPSVPSPRMRIETMRALADAGIPVGVAVTPIIPGLNDSQLVGVLEQAHAAGARRAFRTMLRLPGPVAGIFEERMREQFPNRADRIMNGIREVRGGELNRSAFGERMKGHGIRWQAISQLFELTARRLGMVAREQADNGTEDDPYAPASTFRRPGGQQSLF